MSAQRAWTNQSFRCATEHTPKCQRTKEIMEILRSTFSTTINTEHSENSSGNKVKCKTCVNLWRGTYYKLDRNYCWLVCWKTRLLSKQRTLFSPSSTTLLRFSFDLVRNMYWNSVLPDVMGQLVTPQRRHRPNPQNLWICLLHETKSLAFKMEDGPRAKNVK